MPVAVKEFIDQLFNPVSYTILGVAGFFVMMVSYKVWTKPAIFVIIMSLIVLFFALSWSDPNFNLITTKPDNIPIVALIFIVLFFIWLSLRQAAINDERLEKGLPPMEALEKHERVYVWPDLVFIEFLSAIILMIVLIVWSVAIPAPLEEPANPMKTPNPSKAPWYFLGLQEMLVYFDPWIAGVVLPSLIITGLIVIPYCDKNPKGVGYYTFKERPFVITTFLFGFLVLWLMLIFMGTFLRGPNWNFFGPYEYWDVHKSPVLNNVDLSTYFWVHLMGVGTPENMLVAQMPGILLVLAYFAVTPAVLLYIPLFKKMYKDMGFIRYSIIMFHFLVMMSLPIKMILRWTINLKYIVAIPTFNI